jgi:hypothetical protein
LLLAVLPTWLLPHLAIGTTPCLHLRPLLTGTGLLRRRTTTHLLLRLLLGIAESILSLLICRHCHCAFSFTEKALVTAG